MSSCRTLAEQERFQRVTGPVLFCTPDGAPYAAGCVLVHNLKETNTVVKICREIILLWVRSDFILCLNDILVKNNEETREVCSDRNHHEAVIDLIQSLNVSFLLFPSVASPHNTAGVQITRNSSGCQFVVANVANTNKPTFSQRCSAVG